MLCYLLRKVLCRLVLPATQELQLAAGWEGQTVPAASRARIPPLAGDLNSPVPAHPHSHVWWEGPSALPLPRAATPAGSSNNQTIPSSTHML